MAADAMAGDVPGTDWSFVVRGASGGFTVLLVGGVVQPWIGALLAPLGYVWLLLVALAAFGWAARPQRDRAGTVLDCMTAAVGSYLLVLPLVISAAGALPLQQMFLTALTAVIVGGLAGAFHRSRSLSGRDGSPQKG